MKIEKICEYLVNIGLLKVDDLKSFLKIYSQISQNKYNDKEQLILTLFSYLASVSKNEQHLYDISKNMIESFISSQVVNGQPRKKIITQIIENELDKNNQLLRSANNYKSINKRNFNIIPMKKGKNTQKNNMDNFSFEEGKEFTFSPKINRPKSNRIKDRNNNFAYRYDKDFDVNLFNKNIKNKNKNLYLNNNKINNEIEKLYDYYAKQNIGKNNNFPNNNIFNIRDFYQKEENHMKKVEDKIMILTLKKLKELEQTCTFSPKIHDIPDYIIKNKINNNYFGAGSTYDNNYYNINNIRYINNLPYQNDQIQNMKNNINKIIDEYAMDYYDIPLNKTTKNKKASLSASKEISFGGNLSEKKSAEKNKNNAPIRPNISFSDKEKEENDNKLLNDLQKRFRIPLTNTVKNNTNVLPEQKRNSSNSKSQHKNSINKDKKSEENKSKISSKPNGDKESKISISNQSQKKENDNISYSNAQKEKNDANNNNKEQIDKTDNIEDNNISSNKTDNNEKNNISSNKTDNNEKSKKSSIKTDNNARSKKSSIKTDNNEKNNISSNKTENNEKNNISSNKADNNEKSKKSSIKTDNYNDKNNISSNKTDNNEKSKKSSIKSDNYNEKNDNSTRSKKNNNSSKSNKTNSKKNSYSSSINKTNSKKNNNNSSLNKTNNEKNNNSSIKTDKNNNTKNGKENNNTSSIKNESNNIGKNNNSLNITESIKEEKVSKNESMKDIEDEKKLLPLDDQIKSQNIINETQNDNEGTGDLPLLSEQIKIEVQTNKVELNYSDSIKNIDNEGEKQDKINEKKEEKENNQGLSEIPFSESNMKKSLESNKSNNENNGDEKKIATIQDIITSK